MSASIRSKNVTKAHVQLLFLSELTVKFAGVHRVTLYPDGHYENDPEHSFHLALCATELAANFHPELSVGLVSQYSIIHDLPEVYAGDVPSFERTEAARLQKEKAEATALKRLYKELPPHTLAMLKRYEMQKEPEARFVRLVDKLLPAAIHAVAAKANKDDFLQRFNLTTVKEVDAASERYRDNVQKMFPEFDFVLLLQEMIMQTARGKLFAKP